MVIKEKIYSSEDNKNLVSCVLITYKQSKYIFDCIASVLNQENVKVQLIISDDGSPDYSSEEIENYVDAKHTSNLVSVTYLHHEINVGTVRNINGAIKRAKGEFIKIIGGDDAYPECDVFAEQLKCFFDNPQKLVVVGKIQDTDERLQPVANDRIDNGNILLSHIFDMDYVAARKEMNKKNLFPIANQATCFRKEFFEKYGLCDEKYRVVEDAELALRILEHKSEAMVVDKVCVLHRQKGGISTSRIMFEPRRLSYYEDFVTFSKIQSETHPEVFDFVSRFEIPRVNKFIYEMALAKSKQKNDFQKLGIIIRYCDAILYYMVSKPKRLLQRIKDRFS